MTKEGQYLKPETRITLGTNATDHERELIRRLRELGFEGPFPGGRHDFMRQPRDQLKVPVPRNDAKSREIGVELQKRILREIGVTTSTWSSLV